MSSRFSEESAVAAEYEEKIEQLQNELALAQYEAQKWKEKYLVEKRRRQKTARDLLDLVVRTEHQGNNTAGSLAATGEDSSSLFSPDHTANLLSPTLSSFDFDDDSSEESDDSSDQEIPGAQPLVEATRNESIADESEDGKPQASRTTRANDRSDVFSPSLALDLRDRQSLMFHLNAATIPGRTSRSSTTGSALEAFGGSSRRMADVKSGDNDHSQQQQHLMYRIMYAKPSSRDLWNARAHPNKLQNVARSIMFSMHLKKEHIFERFFVTGMVLNEAEYQHQTTQPLEAAGFWKPRVLYDFPNRANDPPDESIAGFCFPNGVPMVTCSSDQMSTIRGSVVSKWFTKAEPLQKHVAQPPETSGYTFRLTGAKGEVLYGFCVAVMTEVKVSDNSPNGVAPKSPRSGWTPSWFAGNTSSPQNKNAATAHKLAPVCYCFTSKFPFYRFHFALLRMIAENELDQQRLSLDSPAEGSSSAETDEFEIILRPKLDLAMEFTLYHEENPRLRSPSTGSEAEDHNNLNSIGAKLRVSPTDRSVVLSEDASVGLSENNETQPTTEMSKRPSQIRKSMSTDAIGTYVTANEWIVGKPIVKSIDANRPKEYDRVKVGDILEAVDSIATASLSFEEAMILLEKGNRPMRLRFRRPQGNTPPSSSPSKQKQRRSLSPSSVDILHRARRIKINDPGHWSTARFPTFDFSYQFPKRHSDRWAVGVVLRFLAPERVVEIMAFLLLEKQVVIMSDSPAKISAICTALLLLLAPFQWQSTYIPLLPSGLLDFLHSPVPFLVGCHTVSDTSEWADVCFYDVDKDHIAIPPVMRHLGPSSIPNGVELCRLLSKAKERFGALRASGSPWYELTDEQDTIITLTMQEAEIFLRDLGFDISSHDLAASIAGGQSFYDRLQEEVAKEVRNSIYEDYLDEFTQTQLFCQYYESLLQPETQKAGR